jgi:hypothetical protein
MEFLVAWLAASIGMKAGLERISWFLPYQPESAYELFIFWLVFTVAMGRMLTPHKWDSDWDKAKTVIKA